MPRQSNFSSVNATIDNLTVKSINNSACYIPYSLVAAVTESLPEEGESFSTTAFIPYKFKVKSITLQINQSFDAESKVRVNLCNMNYIFTVTPNKPTMNIELSKTLDICKNSYEKITIENMPNDDGDVSCCAVILHGLVQ